MDTDTICVQMIVQIAGLTCRKRISGSMMCIMMVRESGMIFHPGFFLNEFPPFHSAR